MFALIWTQAKYLNIQHTHILCYRIDGHIMNFSSKITPIKIDMASYIHNDTSNYLQQFCYIKLLNNFE